MCVCVCVYERECVSVHVWYVCVCVCARFVNVLYMCSATVILHSKLGNALTFENFCTPNTLLYPNTARRHLRITRADF